MKFKDEHGNEWDDSPPQSVDNTYLPPGIYRHIKLMPKKSDFDKSEKMKISKEEMERIEKEAEAKFTERESFLNQRAGADPRIRFESALRGRMLESYTWGATAERIRANEEKQTELIAFSNWLAKYDIINGDRINWLLEDYEQSKKGKPCGE